MFRWLLAMVSALAPTPVYEHANPAVERWHDDAIAVGWPEQSWPRLACIINRETGGTGDPTVWNGEDPGFGSFGLTQLNMSKGRFGTWAVYAPILSGDITHLYDPGRQPGGRPRPPRAVSTDVRQRLAAVGGCR